MKIKDSFRGNKYPECTLKIIYLWEKQLYSLAVAKARAEKNRAYTKLREELDQFQRPWWLFIANSSTLVDYSGKLESHLSLPTSFDSNDDVQCKSIKSKAKPNSEIC